MRPAQLGVVLQKILRHTAGTAFLLNALFVINIHVEISAVLLGQGNAFVVDQRGVFNRGHARTNRILDALGRMGVRGHSQTEVAGLVDL